MDATKATQPVSTFRTHSAEIIRHVNETQRPVVLTLNGKAAAILQDPEAYQLLLDLAAKASAAEGIRQGLDDLRSGRTRGATDVFADLRNRLGEDDGTPD